MLLLHLLLFIRQKVKVQLKENKELAPMLGIAALSFLLMMLNVRPLAERLLTLSERNPSAILSVVPMQLSGVTPASPTAACRFLLGMEVLLWGQYFQHGHWPDAPSLVMLFIACSASNHQETWRHCRLLFDQCCSL